MKLGFKRAAVPAGGEIEPPGKGFKLERISHIRELAERLGPCQGGASRV